MGIIAILFRKQVTVITLLVILVFTFVNLVPQETKAEFVPGLYLIAPMGREVKTIKHFADTKGLSGFLVGQDWQSTESVESVYNWAVLDAGIFAAKQARKQASIGILPGISTPEWVYQKGAQPFKFADNFIFHKKKYYPKNHRFSTYGQTLKIPVPWDETFLLAWEKFIKAFGDHCRGMDNISMVHMAGPTRHSTEMHLPREDEDKEKWLAIGYTPEKLIVAWRRCIDAYAAAFPDTALVLHLSPVIFKDKVLGEVAKYANETYGQKIFFQNDILKSENKMMREDWAILSKYSQKTTIGFQRGLPRIKNWHELSKQKKLNLQRNEFEGMLNHGLELGAKYIEIGFNSARYFPDIIIKYSERF